MTQLRPNWSSVIRLGPWSFPVDGYTSLDSKRSRIALKSAHAECQTLVRRPCICPLHGELARKDLVKVFSAGHDQYITIAPKEIAALQPDAHQEIELTRFVDREMVDPFSFGGTHYFLRPTNPLARQTYAILVQAMRDEGVSGIARAVIYRRERLVMLRAVETLLTVSVLRYSETVRPAEVFEVPYLHTSTSVEAVRLAKQWIAAHRVAASNLAEYHDPYWERLRELIEGKIAEGVGASLVTSRTSRARRKHA